MTIDQSRTANVLKFPIPRSVKQVQQFVGICGFFQKYIKDFAELCKPLNHLKRKNVKFKWSNECQTSYEKLKDAITNPPVLQIADLTKPFLLMCDASFHCFGACLM